jgi:hypothetical protein
VSETSRENCCEEKEPEKNLGLAVLCGAVDLRLSINNLQSTTNLTIVDRGLTLVDCWVPGTGYALEDSRKSTGFHGYFRREGGRAPSSLTEVERLS